MKICVGLIFIIQFCHGNCGVYNWNISLLPQSSDFSDEFNVQAALENEMRRDLLKITRKIKPDIYPIIAPHKPTPLKTYDSYTVFNRDLPYVEPINYEPIKYGLKYFNDIYEENEHQNDNKVSPKSTKNERHSKGAENTKIIRNDNNDNDFVGTNLFGNVKKQCFSTEEVALLSARKDFENLLPKNLPKCLLNDHMIATLMHYFQACHENVKRMAYAGSKRLAEQAFYDTLGGYLNHYLVPVTKYSFYAGHLSLHSVDSVLQMHKLCKKILNVNGNGWKPPIKDVGKLLKKVKIEPLRIDEKKSCSGPSFCLHLDMDFKSSDSDGDKMLVPLPKLEPEDNDDLLGNIWLPFKRKRTFDLKAENSAYIIVKFYETVTKCYQYEHANQDCFNEKFRSWILENIQVHLSDEQFYPGLGAILRINENLCEDKQQENLYGDNLVEEDFDYGDKLDLVQKRNKGSESFIRFNRLDSETRHFLDNLNKSKLFNGITKKWLEDASDTPKNNYKRNNTQPPGKNLQQPQSQAKPNAPIKTTNQLQTVQNMSLNTNLNVSEAQKLLQKQMEELAKQRLQSALSHTTASSEKPTFRGFPDDFKTPQGMALLSVPVILLLVICCCCCCRRKGGPMAPKMDPEEVLVRRLKYDTHPACLVQSSSSIRSVSSGVMFQPPNKQMAFKGKFPKGPTTTSVSSSAPSKAGGPAAPAPAGKAPPPAKGAPPAKAAPPAKKAAPPAKAAPPPAKGKPPAKK